MFTPHFAERRALRHFMRARRRGDRGSMKYEILTALTEGPRHGYDIMLAIEAARGTRPSPGSIYPSLAMLEDNDFVHSEERDGKRIYTITEKGKELVAQHVDEGGFAHAEADHPAFEVMVRAARTIHGIRSALHEIRRSGDPKQMNAAIEILERTRRELYALLAE